MVVGTKVGRSKHQRVMPGGALEGEEQRVTTSGQSRSKSSSGVSSYFVGRKLDEHRGAFLLEYPMERGRVVEGGWDAMELLWEVSSIIFILLGCCWLSTILPFVSIYSIPCTHKNESINIENKPTHHHTHSSPIHTFSTFTPNPT